MRVYVRLDVLIALALAAACASVPAQYKSGKSMEVEGTVFIETKNLTFKACGYDSDPVALWPPDAANALVTRAQKEGKYNRSYGASLDYIYARVSLTYIDDAKLRKECIGQLRGVYKCATLEPTPTLYRFQTPHTCDFR